MKLTFLGASSTVTGSKYLIEHQDKKILVDCGLFQGLKKLRLLNWEEPKFNPSTIDAILLTHGHLDHTGYLPRLVKLGFKGKIFATAPTLKITEIILKDTAKIQEEEAERANKGGYSKHKPALSLYDLKDVEETKKLFHQIEEGICVNVADLFKVTFKYNGHILGSTFIQVEVAEKMIVFSGDLGREKDILLYPPKKPHKADILLIESTYGGKIHPDEKNVFSELEEIINETINRGGSLFIPSFTVERVQLLMLILWRLLNAKKIPKVPMIMDSPMGSSILDLFINSQDWHKLRADECNQMCSNFLQINNYNETMQVRGDNKPKIVIAGSGMISGGRILSYLEVRGANENDTLLFVGHQAEGTRGRKLLEGEREIKIYGNIIEFRMQIRKIESLSAHADQNDLLNWLSDLKQKPNNIFIVHGEVDQSEAFKQKLKEIKNWDAEIPHLNQIVDLEIF